MAFDQTKTVSPCPFSKGYRIPVEQAWTSLKIFCLYRFIISSLFVIIFYSAFDLFSLEQRSSPFSYFVCQSYLVFTILSAFCIFKRWFSYTSQAQIAIFSDIIFITLLMHAVGGITSGIGILLAISIATGGLLIGGACAILFAALASIAVIIEQIVASQIVSNAPVSFTYAGMLGISFFIIAYLSYILAKRTEKSDKLASQQQQAIISLEELNQYIIQHLQSGIIICTKDQQIKMSNEAALVMCGQSKNNKQGLDLASMSQQLSEYFQQWINNDAQHVAFIKELNKSEVHAKFSLLETRLDRFYMIILEDVSLYNQRLQQSKLASLGCLTASIAHEIRNPLGAISHAGQLLSEAQGLSVQDQRLTEIIQSHCLRVNKIIEDILQLSRREASKREEINLNKWIEHYVESFTQTSEYHSDCLMLEIKKENLSTYMDSGHLKQILDNVCLNALKYGCALNDKFIIELGCSKNAAYIRVIDHGVPITTEIASHLFEPFFTTSRTGTGLGLYISKELSELNQAELSYALVENKNCFTLRLPAVNHSMIEI